jgi:hypothetical protein
MHLISSRCRSSDGPRVGALPWRPSGWQSDSAVSPPPRLPHGLRVLHPRDRLARRAGLSADRRDGFQCADDRVTFLVGGPSSMRILTDCQVPARSPTSPSA